MVTAFGERSDSMGDTVNRFHDESNLSDQTAAPQSGEKEAKPDIGEAVTLAVPAVC